MASPVVTTAAAPAKPSSIMMRLGNWLTILSAVLLGIWVIAIILANVDKQLVNVFPKWMITLPILSTIISAFVTASRFISFLVNLIRFRFTRAALDLDAIGDELKDAPDKVNNVLDALGTISHNIITSQALAAIVAPAICVTSFFAVASTPQYRLADFARSIYFNCEQPLDAVSKDLNALRITLDQDNYDTIPAAQVITDIDAGVQKANGDLVKIRQGAFALSKQQRPTDSLKSYENLFNDCQMELITVDDALSNAQFSLPDPLGTVQGGIAMLQKAEFLLTQNGATIDILPVISQTLNTLIFSDTPLVKRLRQEGNQLIGDLAGQLGAESILVTPTPVPTP